MNSPHEADLVARWRRGDAEAFEGLVRRWQQPIARFLFRITGKAELVHDLCQEIFLRVYQSRASYRESGHFDAWLYRIALNVARDAGRRRSFSALPNGKELADPAASAESICQQRELQSLVTASVAELPEALRVVLALHLDEGLAFEEIARLTGTPASTLKSRFSVALRRLRHRLGKTGYAPEEDAR